MVLKVRTLDLPKVHLRHVRSLRLITERLRSDTSQELYFGKDDFYFKLVIIFVMGNL